MATNPSGIAGALFDSTASNGLGGLTTGIGFGTRSVMLPLQAGIEVNEVPALARIGAGTAGVIQACGFAGKGVAVKTATGTVANGALIVAGWNNQSGRTITTGQSVLAVAV